MFANRRLKILAFGLFALSVIYCLQILSPLRLDTDAVTYLSLSESALSGKGFNYQGENTHFPVGFPLIIMGLNLFGIASSYSFVGLNIAFLGVGIATSYSIFCFDFSFKRWVSMLLCCLTLLSYVFVKHTTIPLSDIPYFGVSMLCLLLLSRFERSRSIQQYQSIALATGLALLAISIRTIGVALIPAILWTILRKRLVRLPPLVFRRRKFIVIFSLIVLLLGFLVSRTSYFHEATAIYASTSFPQAVIYNLSCLLKAWGVIAINIPASKSPWFLDPIYFFVGAVVLAFGLQGLWLRRQNFGAVEIYTLAFTFILLAWPYYGPRLWLPIVPLVMGLVTLGCQQHFKRPKLRQAIVLYLTLFSILGIGALGYSTRISLAGPKFPKLYGDGTYSQTYQYALNSSNRRPGETDKLHHEVLHLLRRYEPRAALGQ